VTTREILERMERRQSAMYVRRQRLKGRSVRQSIRLLFVWIGGRVRPVVIWFAASAHVAAPLPWRALFKLAIPLWVTTRLLALLITYVSQTLLRASVIQSPRATCEKQGQMEAWNVRHSGACVPIRPI